MSDWVVRRAVREDDGCIVQMWLHQLLRYSYDSPHTQRPKAGSEEHIAFWRRAQPVAEGLLRSPSVTTLVACLPDRADHRPGEPAVAAAWAMYDSRRVYGVGIKREYLPSPEASASQNAVVRDIGTDLARLVLGGVSDECKTVLPTYDLTRLGYSVPWGRDPLWLPLVADVSRALLDGDETTSDVCRWVHDPQRTPWTPSERRVA